MDQEVAKTLGELELKLQELERELTTIGHRDTPAEPLHAPGKLIDEAVEQHDGAGKATAESSAEEMGSVDREAFGGPAVFGGEEVPSQGSAATELDWTVEVHETAYGEIPTPQAPPTAPPGPPLPNPTPTPQPPPTEPPGPPSPSTPPGPPPPSTPPVPPPTPAPSTSPSPTGWHSPVASGSQLQSHGPDPRYPAAVEESHSVDLAELVRFREKLASTMDALIDEYSRLLSVDPPARPRAGA